MKVLLDECAPKFLKRALLNHEVRTVQEVGCSGLRNGELIKRAGTEFDVFVTADKNLRYQQNLTERKIPIIELSTNKLSVVKELIGEIQGVSLEYNQAPIFKSELRTEKSGLMPCFVEGF
jgi:hypothetical protein